MTMTHALEDDTETTHPKFYLRLNIVGDFLWIVGNPKDVHKQSPLAPDRSQDCKRLKQLFSFQPIGFTSGQIPAVDVLIANPDSLPIR